MGLFEHWPYTNFHDLNLDWIIKKIPEIFTASAQAVQSAETAVSAKNDAVSAKEAAQLSAENAAASEESAGQSAESAQNYAEHIADPVGGLVTNWLTDNIEPTTPPVDSSLTIQGAAADAKETGDQISELRSQIILNGGVPTAVKNAIGVLFQNVAFKNDTGYSDEIDTVYNWATEINIVSISVTFEPGDNVIHYNDTLDSLRPYLTVTALYDNGVSTVVTSYLLSGNLKEATNTITVVFGGQTATFTVEPVWSFAPTAYRICNAAATIGTGDEVVSIATTTNTRRATTDKLCFFIPEGTYAISCPTAYYFGILVFKDEGATPSFETIDWSNSGSAKTYWTGSVIRTINTSWQNDTYQLEVSEPSWFYANFKKGEAGTTNFASSDMTTLLSGFTITKVG